jgi:hypothetical protein
MREKLPWFVALALGFAAGGCSTVRDQEVVRGAPRAETAPAAPPAAPPNGDARRALQKGEVTGALERKANAVLEEHGDRPVGTEVPFELDGRRYVARIEQHYHEPGSAEGPWGPHKGVTLYATE